MIDSLPLEISQKILFRLSLQCLIICTSVCKSWNSMIKNSDFIRDHLKFKTKYGTPLLLFHCNTRSDDNCFTSGRQEGEAVYSVYYDNDNFSEYCNVKFPIFVDNIGRMLKTWFRVVGTCNGLVCLADESGVADNMFIIINPLIRKLVILPLPYSRIENYDHILSPVKYNASVGFGYDASTNDYKVVRLVNLTNSEFVSDPESYVVAEVYSLATGSWSPSRLVHSVSEVDARTPQALVNGVLHWPAVHEDHYFILTFDVHTESFSKIMMPEVIPASTSAELRVSVSSDRKSIALFFRHFGKSQDMSDRFLDVWVMQEYGVHESWTIWARLPSTGASVTYLPRALCFRVNGEIVAELLDDDVCQRLWVYPCMGHQLYSIPLHASRGPPMRWMDLLQYDDFKYTNVNPYMESLVLLDMDNAVSY